MQGIILVGGLGTRLKSVVSDIPKPMAPINGRPFLEYLLEKLNKSGFQKVILATGYMGEYIESYFGNRYEMMELVYSKEDNPLGTGGCVINAIDKVTTDYFFVINGDTYFDVDYSKINFSNDVGIICKYMEDSSRYGSVEIIDGKVKRFNEKLTNFSGYINGGVYYFRKSILEDYNLLGKFSMEKDFFEKYVNQIDIEAIQSSGYFIDIGVPEDYEKFVNYQKQGTISR